MNNIIKKTVGLGFVMLLTALGLMLPGQTSAQNDKDSANGHGTILAQNESGEFVRRQFSFNARRKPDGSVSGNAILHNPAFTGANGHTYQASFEISCLKVVGNTAIFGGVVKRTNDPNLVDAAYFSVEDNGDPGKDRDRISLVYFNDNDPNTNPGDPQFCQNFVPSDFEPLIYIESGNVQVRGN